MKRFFAKIAETLENPDGSLSSRRVFGGLLIAAGLVGWYMAKDVQVCLVVIGLGATLLGITTKDKQARLGPV